MYTLSSRILTLLLESCLLLAMTFNAHAAENQVPSYEINLKSRHFTPQEETQPAKALATPALSRKARHVLIQFRDIPTPEQRRALEVQGLRLLDYIPNNAWNASVPGTFRTDGPGLPPIRWMGSLQP